MVTMLNEANFATEIKSGIVLVDFFAEWCGPCRMLAPVLETLSKEMAGKVKICKVDIDQSQEIAAQFQITSVPTMILFKNGQKDQTIVGLKSIEALRDTLNSAHSA